MKRRIGTITVFVADHDEAKNWYVDKLGFKIITDETFGEGQRWVALAYPGQEDVTITLVKADSAEYKKHLGAHTADHVFLVIETDDCERDFSEWSKRGVKFFGKPVNMPWGKEVVFADLYGNRFDLLEIARP